MPISIYGGSDDLIEVRGDVAEEFNAVLSAQRHHVLTSTGVLVRLELASDGDGVWRAEVPLGEEQCSIIRARGDDAGDDTDGCPGYSDKVVVTSPDPIEWVAYFGDVKYAYRPPPPKLREFRVTFGQKYPREEHPTLLVADHDGWVTVRAANEEQARRLTDEVLGDQWSHLYAVADFQPEHFPLGELATIQRQDGGTLVTIGEDALARVAARRAVE